MAVARSISGSGGFSVASSIVSGEGVQQVDNDMKPLQGEVAPLVDWIGYGPPVKVNEDWTVKWVKDEDMPVFVTIISAIDGSQTTLTAGTELSANDARMLQVGQVIHFNSAATNDEQIRVTANDQTTVTFTRGYAGTSAAVHAVGDIGYLLMPTYLDTDSFPESPRSRGEFATTYCSQAMYELTETDYKTMQPSLLTGQGDQLNYDMMKLRKWALKELNNQIIYGRAVAPTGSAPGNFNGLRALITTNVKAVTGNLAPGDFADTVELLEQRDPDLSDLTILGNRNSKRIFDSILVPLYPRSANGGTTVSNVNFNVAQSIELNGTVLKWMTVPQIKDGELLLVRKGDVKLHPGAIIGGMGTGWVEMTRQASDFNARKRANALSWIGTLILKNEKRHAKITFTGTTMSGYDNII